MFSDTSPTKSVLSFSQSSFSLFPNPREVQCPLICSPCNIRCFPSCLATALKKQFPSLMTLSTVRLRPARFLAKLSLCWAVRSIHMTSSFDSPSIRSPIVAPVDHRKAIRSNDLFLHLSLIEVKKSCKYSTLCMIRFSTVSVLIPSTVFVDPPGT